MMRMTTKLIRNAMYEGQSASSPAHRSWSPCGTRISRIRSVIAIAKTPSLNASTREGLSVMGTKMLFLGRFCTNHNRPGFMHRATRTLPLALIAAAVAACGNSNGPDARFACLGQALPTTAPPTIAINGQVADIVTHSPVSSAPVFAFRTGDTTTLAADTTNAPGFYSLTISTGGTPVDGYLRVTQSTYMTTYAYPAQPLRGDTVNNILMVTPTEFSLLAAAAGITPQAGKAFIGVVVKDCTGAAITGATVTSTPGATVLYNVAGVPSSSATATAADGIAYIANVAAGNVTIMATASGHTLRQHVVNAHADAITLTEIRP